MEIWDLYDMNRNPLGRTHIRGQQIPEGCYHLVVHVWIRNRRGEYLISQRSANRPSFPLMWETVGGSVLAGENSLTGAIREVQEEVGIVLPANNASLLFSKIRNDISGVKPDHFLDVWLFQYDGDITLCNATTDEVAQTQWMTVPQIKTLFDSGKLVKTLAYFFQDIERD